MAKTEKILVFYNEFEARLLEGLLKERGIPCIIKSYYDSAYDGMWQSQMGWGHMDAPPEYRDEILKMYAEIAGNQADGNKENQE
jgi:hypothetical protein